MSFKHSWLLSEERGFFDMGSDLITSLLAMSLRFTLVLGVMLFIVSLGRDAWSVFGKHE
jgi:hypothetical protein